MIDAFIDTLELFPQGLVYIGLGLIVIALAKLIQDFLTPYRINEQLSHKNNVALALSITGYYFGVIAAFLGALYQPFSVVRDDPHKLTTDLGWDVLEVFLYSLASIIVLNFARILVDRVVLYKFDTKKEIVDEQNVGTGAVEFGVYVAVGLVIAASTAGGGSGAEGVTETSNLDAALRSLAFFGLGMVVLVLYALFYELTTSFNIHNEIADKNTAVGVALGGNLIAVGVVTFKAVFGEFVSWEESLAAFLTFAVIGFALLYVVRLIVDFILLPSTKIAHELAVDRNLGAAFIESAVVINVALILNFAI